MQSALIREEIIATTIMTPSWENIWPASPLIMVRGRYTTQVVIVEATILIMTVPAPLTAASRISSSSLVALKQLSMTTMELSTIIPIAMTRAPVVMILRS